VCVHRGVLHSRELTHGRFSRVCGFGHS
jgi:hypothetical protein